AYTKLIEVNPQLYAPYVQRAVSYTALKDYKNAIADYSKIIERSPEDPEYYEDRAQVYTRAGELQKAVDDYNKVIKLNPNYSIGYHERAQVFLKLDGKQTPRVVADEKKAKSLGYVSDAATNIERD
ncbi:MAG TPA: tetratricopeptide repeat protein, partial [Chroococcales cyanobacterium]